MIQKILVALSNFSSLGSFFFVQLDIISAFFRLFMCAQAVVTAVHHTCVYLLVIAYVL